MSLDFDKQNAEAYFNKNLKVVCLTIIISIAIIFGFVYLSDIYMIRCGYVYKSVIASTIQNYKYQWVKEEIK